MQIGFIGLGVVGTATMKLVASMGNNDIRFRDPAKGLQDELEKASTVFVSVPVPTLPHGPQDISNLISALNSCPKKCHVFIRSSVIPGVITDLQKKYPEIFIHALPEFLTERTADEDAQRLPLVASVEGAKILKKIFINKEIIMLPDEESCSMVKYVHNVFCAMKVGFFNTVWQACNGMGLDYNQTVNAACAVTGFIEKTHTQVPGPDGALGFGGKCLPKDLLAFCHLLEKGSEQKTFLREVLNENFYNRFGSLF